MYRNYKRLNKSMDCNRLESFLKVNTEIVKLEREKRAREKEELVSTRG